MSNLSFDELLAQARAEMRWFEINILEPYRKILLKNYNPSQPRVPAGQPGGGQWGASPVAARTRQGKPNPYAPEPKPSSPPPAAPSPPKGLERNPDKAKDDFAKRGDNYYYNRQDGSIWSRDTSGHGGEQWKRWANEKDYNARKKPQSIWEDGGIRKCLNLIY